MKIRKISTLQTPSVKVLLVDPLHCKSSLLKRALLENEYQIVEQITDITNIADRLSTHKPDIMMISMDTPDTTTLDKMSELRQLHPMPVIVFAEKDSPHMIQQVVKAGVNAFIVDDIQIQRLPSIVNIAIARFNEQQKLEKELNTVKTKLADRKIVERAKGLLMAQRNINEEEAYNSLRKMAMDKGQSMANISENLIDAFKLLND
jgi:response regulator NasT